MTKGKLEITIVSLRVLHEGECVSLRVLHFESTKRNACGQLVENACRDRRMPS